MHYTVYIDLQEAKPVWKEKRQLHMKNAMKKEKSGVELKQVEIGGEHGSGDAEESIGILPGDNSISDTMNDPGVPEILVREIWMFYVWNGG